MGRRPCCAKEGLNRGAWSSAEDKILVDYINAQGEGKWRDLPRRAGNAPEPTLSFSPSTGINPKEEQGEREGKKLSTIKGPLKMNGARVGLKRCGKSCRLRWLNYLRPDIKRGNISKEEEDLIIRLHKLLGNRYPFSSYVLGVIFIFSLRINIFQNLSRQVALS